MARRFTGLSTRRLNQALQSPTVRKALAARARRVLPRTRAIATNAGATEFARALRVTEGTRPGTGARDGLQRPYARIAATVTTEIRRADARSRLSRRQILRRGASG